MGPKESDILRDLNIPLEFPSKSEKRFSFSLEGESTGTPVGTIAKVSGNILVDVVVSYNNEKKGTSDNSLGKTFEGIIFDAFISQFSASPIQENKILFQGYFTVQSNNREYKQFFYPFIEPIIYQAGTIPMAASIFISSEDIYKTKYFSKAFISIGTLNRNLFPVIPIKMTWSLQQNQILLSK